MIISPFPTQSVIMKFCLMEFSNDKCNRFQEFYEEGEREILLAELSSLRDQVCVFPESCTKVAFLLANLFGKLLFAFFYKWKVFVVQLLQFHERSSMQSNPNFSPQPQVRLKLSLAPFFFPFLWTSHSFSFCPYKWHCCCRRSHVVRKNTILSI